MSDVRDIVRDWLKANGYDGLYAAGECACLADDLAPCSMYNEVPGDCVAGYRREGCDETCGNGCDFHIMGGKPEVK